MSYYKICPECEAHLDPGEVCTDCTKKDAPLEATSEASCTSNGTPNSISTISVSESEIKFFRELVAIAHSFEELYEVSYNVALLMITRVLIPMSKKRESADDIYTALDEYAQQAKQEEQTHEHTA